MRILLSYFSRTGYSERLALAIGDELISRGHSLEWEVVKPAVYYSWLREAARDFPRYPSIACSLVSSFWRRHHIETYYQVEEDIQALRYPDVSGFDRVCIGGPKWAQVSYPVARYLQTVRGIRGKKVGSFATFGGPPLKSFELELIEKPMARLLGRMGAEVVANLGVSSAYHEASIMPLFRLMSLLRFGRPIEAFVLGSEYAAAGIQRFCNDLLQDIPARDERGRDQRSGRASGRTASMSSRSRRGKSHAQVQ